MNRKDPIIHSLMDCRNALRRNAALDSAFPLLVYGVPAIACLSFAVNAQPEASFGLITTFIVLISIVCWLRTRSISLQQTAGVIDAEFALNDGVSSYLQFSEEDDRTLFLKLHITSVSKLFPKGIDWRPNEPEPRKMGILSLSMMLGLAAIFMKPIPGQPELLMKELLTEANRARLSNAGKALSSDKIRELAVSIEQFSKTASPVSRSDRTRIIEQVRNIQREINSSEAEFAGEFLGDLLSKSSAQSSVMNAISQALRKAQWRKASDLARSIDNSDAGELSGAEREILNALQKDDAQVKSGSNSDGGSEPKSEKLRKRLASLARQHSSDETRRVLDSMQDVRTALAEIADSSSSSSKGVRNKSESSNSTKTPSITAPKSARHTSPVQKAGAVNPFVAAGPGQSIAAIMDLQDTGLSTLFPVPPDQASFKQSNPVARAVVPFSKRELVKEYFERRSVGEARQMGGSND